MKTETKNPQLPQNAVKCRFFAQYWGQKVMKKNIEGLEKFYSEPDGFIRSMTTDSPFFLELKPISKITDEDALKSWENDNYVAKLEDIKHVNNLFADISFRNIDYLRSKGYAVPFMEYSVDDLISFGWLRLS